MTFADIEAKRELPVADRHGIAFRHADTPAHTFITQFPMSIDKPELIEGRLEKRWTVKRVGRAEGGHLFDEGFVPRTFTFKGFALVRDECLSLTNQAAAKEAQLLYEFLRGNTEGPINSNDYPNPIIQVGYDINDPSIGSYMPFDPASQPYKPTAQPYKGTGASADARFLSSYFILDPESLTYDKPIYNKNIYIPFSLSLKQIPKNIVRT